LTFGDVCERYVTEYLGRNDTPDGPRWTGQHLRPRTAEQAEYHIKTIRHIAVPAADGKTVRLESKPFTAVTTTDVKAVQAARRSHGSVGCNRLMARLRHLFNWSIAEGFTERSPFKRGDVTLIKLDTNAETERTRRLQPGEQARLLQHANPHLQALIIAALSTGCRRGELLSLQWSQLQRDEQSGRQTIVLPASKTKTHKPRVIPVSLNLHAVLEMRRTDPKGEALPPEAFVFGNPVGERIGSVKTAWRNTCRRAGIEGLHFHDLRREFACRLLESSADLHDVRDFLGHANITTTSRYVRSTPVRLAQALERMEAETEVVEDADDQPRLAAVR
jgi:integrase